MINCLYILINHYYVIKCYHRRLKPSLLKKHWRREGKNEVIGRKPTVRKGSVTVTSGDHNNDEQQAKPPMSMGVVNGCVRFKLLKQVHKGGRRWVFNFEGCQAS